MRELFEKIEKVHFPESQYVQEAFDKKQIYLHHTASGKGAEGDIRYWLSDKKRIATCVIITWDGKILQLFSSKFWGHHLGVKSKVFRDLGLAPINKKLNQASIAIEIDSWGPLEKRGEEYFSWAGTKVPREDVIFYHNGFKGHHYYEKYTPQQIETVRMLLEFWGNKYNIPLDYDHEAMWNVSKKALTGEPGVYTHNSVRSDKCDIVPQPDLIQMLKGLAR